MSMNVRPSKLLFWEALSGVSSLLIGYGIFTAGKAADCKPHEADGQCGLSTFAGLIEGVAVGLIVFLIASGYIAYRVYRGRKVKSSPRCKPG